MQVKQFILDIENDKKVYTVFYNENGIMLQINHFYLSNLDDEVVIYAIEEAIETNDDVYTIEDINLEVLGELWIKYQKEQYI